MKHNIEIRAAKEANSHSGLGYNDGRRSGIDRRNSVTLYTFQRGGSRIVGAASTAGLTGIGQYGEVTGI